MRKLLLSLCALPLSLSAEPPTLNLIVDPFLSPYVGAEDLLTLHAGVQYGENWLLRNSTTPSQGWGPSLKRAGELALWWEPYNYMTMVTQHEVFGHGYRVRNSSHMMIAGYKFGTPPPYGVGGASTALRCDSDRVSPFEGMALDIAGSEASWILADRLKLQWLQTGTINPTQSSLYWYAQHDLTYYINNSWEGDTGDISCYLNTLNQVFPKGHLSMSRLKKLAWINYADPFSYYALYAAWWSYLIKGEKGPIPMIPMGSYKYLPGLRLGLTPFGPEYYIENYLVKDQKPIYFYVRGGEFAGLRSCGFGIEHAYLWTVDNTPWGIRADAWLQPNVPYKANSTNNLSNIIPSSSNYKSRFGLSLSLIGHKKISKQSALFFQVGGKTAGYLPGEPLDAAVTLRVGFSFF